MSDTAPDTLLTLEGAPGLHRKKTGWLPVYIVAALGFAFVIGFGDETASTVARVVLGLGSVAVAGAIVLLGQVILTLRGRRRFPYLEEMPTQAALAEEKTQVLAAIKEIEFDHDMNKINDRDYQDLRNRYEAEALRVLKAIDDERRDWEKKATALARGHLGQVGLTLSPMPGVKRKKAAAAKPAVAETAAEPAGAKEAPAGAQSDPVPEAATAAAAAPAVAETAGEPAGAKGAPAGAQSDPVPEGSATREAETGDGDRATGGGTAGADADARDDRRPCAGCGRENDADAVFCVGCGARLEALPRTCPSCDTENEADARFCKRCGTRLEEAAS